MARIDRLSEAARRLLQIASVLGRECPLRLMEALWEGPEALAPLLQELQRREFLYEHTGGGEPVYAFKHVLTHEVAYDSLLPARRQTLHAAVGHTLERLYADRQEAIYDRLAYHYARTAEADKAVTYLTRFAGQATRAYAHETAATALQEALRHVERLPVAARDHRRLEVVLSLAQAFSFLGRFGESLELLLQHQEQLTQLQDSVLAGPYYFRLGRTYSLLGDQARAAQHTRRALDAATRCGDEATMGMAYYELAQEIFLSGPPQQALEYCQRAVRLLERTGEPWWLGMTYWLLGSTYTFLGAFVLALEATTRARAIGKTLGDHHIQSYAAFTTCWIEATRGNWQAGMAACQESLALARDAVNRAHALGVLGYAYLEQGEATQVIPLFEQALRAWTGSLSRPTPWGTRGSPWPGTSGFNLSLAWASVRSATLPRPAVRWRRLSIISRRPYRPLLPSRHASNWAAPTWIWQPSPTFRGTSRLPLPTSPKRTRCSRPCRCRGMSSRWCNAPAPGG